ncbi:hypothetical protein [Nostoc sp. WHI]|uniref:hypothetical protein n=1 Tax=Nostoc sp. WHI TaxID=2650611 RepID=UPI0018C4DA87|nr:hypothetical protein [Nostoc sp. WHI]MBG1268701.1 hypothetical protein [Nostoc sp. WHI]
MALNYNNPNDWGKSPLTDRALRIERLKAELDADNEAALTKPEIIEITKESNPAIWELLQPPSD